MQQDTLAAKAPSEQRSTPPHVLPIYASSSFVFGSAEDSIAAFQQTDQHHVYSRYGNPTTDAVAAKIAELETWNTGMKALGLMTSSGMAAIHALVVGLLQHGDAILTQGNLYGGTTELFNTVFAPLGIRTHYVNLADIEAVEQALKADPSIKLLYCETPANPTLACYDLSALAVLARQYGAWSAADNTFGTPILQQPLAHGIDFVIHSTTKYLNGHGNSIAGFVAGADVELMRQRIWRTIKLAGSNCSPFEAWLTHNGIKTLALRMERQCANALRLARFLEAHPAVSRVNYPGLASHPDHALAARQMRNGFGAMLSFELSGGLEAGIRLMNGLSLCVIAPTLGDVDTLALHPATSSHLRVPPEQRAAYGITDGLIRISVGIENADDLIADLSQGLEA